MLIQIFDLKKAVCAAFSVFSFPAHRIQKASNSSSIPCCCFYVVKTKVEGILNKAYSFILKGKEGFEGIRVSFCMRSF